MHHTWMKWWQYQNNSSSSAGSSTSWLKLIFIFNKLSVKEVPSAVVSFLSNNGEKKLIRTPFIPKVSF